MNKEEIIKELIKILNKPAEIKFAKNVGSLTNKLEKDSERADRYYADQIFGLFKKENQDLLNQIEEDIKDYLTKIIWTKRDIDYFIKAVINKHKRRCPVCKSILRKTKGIKSMEEDWYCDKCQVVVENGKGQEE